MMESENVVEENQAAKTSKHWHKFQMEWSIDSFAEILVENRIITSGYTTNDFTSKMGHTWRLAVRGGWEYNQSIQEQCLTHYNFYLSIVPRDSDLIKAKWCLQVKDSQTGALYSPAGTKEKTEYFGKDGYKYSSDPNTGIAWEVKKEDFEREISKHNGLLSHDGTLTTVWTVTTLQIQTDFHGSDKSQNIANQFPFDRELFADVKLITGNKVFNGHKIILSARSRVFRAMFSSCMIETQSDEVDLSQHRPTAVGIMLDYVYTGKYAQFYAKEVLQLADMYDIPGLKSAAEMELIQNLRPKSAAKYMHYGDLFQAPKLKAASIDYIVRNQLDVFENDAHKDYMDAHPELFKEILAIKLHSS